MNKEQAEKRLSELMTEAVKILKEFEPNSNYLTMVYLGDIGNGRVNIYNDAFRYDDVKPIDINDYDFNAKLKNETENPKYKEVNLDAVPDVEKFFESFDKNVVLVSQVLGGLKATEFLIGVSMLRSAINREISDVYIPPKRST